MALHTTTLPTIWIELYLHTSYNITSNSNTIDKQTKYPRVAICVTEVLGSIPFSMLQ